MRANATSPREVSHLAYSKLISCLLLSLLLHSLIRIHTYTRSLSLSISRQLVPQLLYSSLFLHSNISSRPFLLSLRPTTRDVDLAVRMRVPVSPMHESRTNGSVEFKHTYVLRRTPCNTQPPSATRGHDEYMRTRVRRCNEHRRPAASYAERIRVAQFLHDSREILRVTSDRATSRPSRICQNHARNKTDLTAMYYEYERITPCVHSYTYECVSEVYIRPARPCRSLCAIGHRGERSVHDDIGVAFARSRMNSPAGGNTIAIVKICIIKVYLFHGQLFVSCFFAFCLFLFCLF